MIILIVFVVVICFYFQYKVNQKSTSSKSDRIYVPITYKNRHRIEYIINILKINNFNVSIMFPPVHYNATLTLSDYNYNCKLEFNEIKKADTILGVMTDLKEARPSDLDEYPEIGYAIGAGKRIIVVFDEKNIEKYMLLNCCASNRFFCNPKIEYVSSIEDAMKLMNGHKIKLLFDEHR